MIELDVAEGSLLRCELQLIHRTKQRHEVAATSAIPTAPIEITTPMVTALTTQLAAADAGLAAFWKAESGRFHYDYVTFRATFMPLERAQFERAWIEVQLSAQRGREAPIAYSLAPDRIADVTQLTHKAKVGARLQFLSGEMGAEEGKEAREYVLRAWREHTASPYWELSRTDTTPLVGTFPLHLIVRSPVESRATGCISVRAVIERRTLWMVTSDPAAPIGDAVEFALGPTIRATRRSRG
jgi:hypothetical protein